MLLIAEETQQLKISLSYIFRSIKKRVKSFLMFDTYCDLCELNWPFLQRISIIVSMFLNATNFFHFCRSSVFNVHEAHVYNISFIHYNMGKIWMCVRVLVNIYLISYVSDHPLIITMSLSVEPWALLSFIQSRWTHFLMWSLESIVLSFLTRERNSHNYKLKWFSSYIHSLCANV